MIENILYLGHSAIFLNGINGTNTIAIDPWLQGNPLCPSEFKTPEKLDIIVLTHGHSDHTGGVVELANTTGAKVCATFELCSLLIEDGLNSELAIFMNKGGTTNINGINVTLTHALHSSSYTLKNGTTKYAGEACGCIVTDTKNTFYHAGDTALFSDMKLISEIYKPNFAFLPIGDKFTMGQKEAAIAANYIKAMLTFPIHYKTFGALEQNAEVFIKECSESGLSAEELVIGEKFLVD